MTGAAGAQLGCHADPESSTRAAGLQPQASPGAGSRAARSDKEHGSCQYLSV